MKISIEQEGFEIAEMKIQLSEEELKTMESYRLPRYAEIPNVGLYLNQVAKYINEYMEPFCDMNITESMISNYVKKHLVSNPIKKQYDREQIAYLIFIAVAKAVLSMDHIQMLFELKKQAYESQVAYDYFACEFENALQYIFGICDEMKEAGKEQNDAKMLCRDVILTAVRKIYLDACFRKLENKTVK